MSFNEKHYSSFNDIIAKRDAVEAMYKTIPVYGISRHEKLKSIHDYLANNIVYDKTIKEANIFEDISGLFGK